MPDGNLSGLLAPSPLFCRDCVGIENPTYQALSKVEAISSREIVLRAWYVQQPNPWHQWGGRRIIVPVCTTRYGDLMGICLRKFSEDGSYIRQNCHGLTLVKILHSPEVYWKSNNILPFLPATMLGNVTVPWPIYGLEYLRDHRAHLCQIALPDEIRCSFVVYPGES